MWGDLNSARVVIFPSFTVKVGKSEKLVPEIIAALETELEVNQVAGATENKLGGGSTKEGGFEVMFSERIIGRFVPKSKIFYNKQTCDSYPDPRRVQI